MARWLVYSPLGAAELEKVEASYQLAVARHGETHPGATASLGSLQPAPAVPRAAEATAAFRAADKPAPPLVLARLKGCRRGLMIIEPAELETDRAQVSAVRFLLQRLGQGLVDWGDGQLQPTEEALRSLEAHLDAGAWDPSAPAAPQAALPQVRNPNATAPYPRGDVQGNVLAQDPHELLGEALAQLKQIDSLLDRMQLTFDTLRSRHAIDALKAHGELSLLRARLLELWEDTRP
jgi:hypothetical protein